MVRPSGQLSFASAINTIGVRCFVLAMAIIMTAAIAHADSVNSPNITMNVDTNRAIGSGNGAVGTSVVVNTITLAEISLPEYSSGTGKSFSIQARPGFQFDPTSSVTAQSATIGINGGGLNAVATVVPTGAANEIITFNLTSGTNVNVQDIIRINGIRVRILSAAGAAGPAQTTLQLTTTTAGGAFTNQGIVAANIQKGAADRLEFSAQPGDTQAAGDLLPAVKVVDFGGNLLNTETRQIELQIEDDPGSATLLGTTQRQMVAGVAAWDGGDNLNITTAGNGYSLLATGSGTFLTSNFVESAPFNIAPGNAGRIEVTTQPGNVAAGDDILVAVTAFDEFDNVLTTPSVDITLDSAVNPGGWPLLVTSSLTKTTVNGVATWDAADDLRITAAVEGYRLIASGLGAPAITDLFNVSAGAPAALRFDDQPSNITQNEAMDPPVTVEAIDAFGNVADTGVDVQLALGTAPCGGNVTGGAAATAAGVAVFESVSVDTPCEGNTLAATSAGLVGATSDTFNVAAADTDDDVGGAPPCGVCGAGLATMAPLMLAACGLLRRSRRRR